MFDLRMGTQVTILYCHTMHDSQPKNVLRVSVLLLLAYWTSSHATPFSVGVAQTRDLPPFSCAALFRLNADTHPRLLLHLWITLSKTSDRRRRLSCTGSRTALCRCGRYVVSFPTGKARMKQIQEMEELRYTVLKRRQSGHLSDSITMPVGRDIILCMLCWCDARFDGEALRSCFFSAGYAGFRLHVQESEAVGGVHGVPLLRKPLHQVLLGNGEHPAVFGQCCSGRSPDMYGNFVSVRKEELEAMDTEDYSSA